MRVAKPINSRKIVHMQTSLRSTYISARAHPRPSALLIVGAMLAPRYRKAMHCGRTACAVFFLLFLSSTWCYAGDIVFIRSVGHPTPEQHDLEVAAQFYGVNLEVLNVAMKYSPAALSVVGRPTTLAVAIDADALALVDQSKLLRDLKRKPGDSVPLLILGVTSQTNKDALNRWSGESEMSVGHLTSPRQLNYEVGLVPGITEQLSGLKIPFPGQNTYYFSLTKHNKAREIMMARKDNEVVPVFIETDLPQQKVFILARKQPPDKVREVNADNVIDAFVQIAPVMMFVKHCAGEQGWHAVGHYANFTIDDPWLRKSYGDLNYSGLLQEMEKHNFHTTIAFIPWNYDRSEASVVSLFRNHPDRLSICIHGNNHDHKEFESLQSRPLSDQVADLKQALARMDKFQKLTGIPYDKVFVFPHSIGPEPTLEKLKAYNYLATVNSTNVPMGSPIPSSSLFALRPVTMSYGDFPSIMRYPAEMENSRGFIAINDFLDNPLLFYSHQEFFAKGINEFDAMADEVNRIEPDTDWDSLGDIAKHLYLLRKRADSNYDVLAFTNSITLTNTSQKSAVYFITKQEAALPHITSIDVNGGTVPFQVANGNLTMSVAIPAGETRIIVVRYTNDLNVASIEVSHESLRIYLLRKASDFRDIVLSKYKIGEMFTALYYRDDMTPTQSIAYVFIMIVVCIGAAGGVLIAIRRFKSC